MKGRDIAILPYTPAADQSEKEGFFVMGGATAAVVSSATALPSGVIVDGDDTDGSSSVALMGFGGTVHVKLSGTVSRGNKLQLAADGSVVADAGSGARVLVAEALESGVSGDLIEASFYGPVVYAS